ncbi:helix-turn-helix transcriptional regulator [Lactobacillus sp. UCMA15818]|uniref:helix-turn-helix transcriptional regulator n=1 Tax=Lactobacillus sp. UCMA15818 TaxID=2583394 RepID=UPI0025AFB1C3|nr:helix-turn-helix transcriptional regulator [Lactobacillus sp. UCMA15818]MDN2452191.1 helix-turn-helix transcriptional regulator [Lactobacillus sp. UCMA15818]
MLKNRVKVFRVEAGLSQKELSFSADVTRQTMSLIEKGEYNPSISLCLRICYKLDKTLNEVFWLNEEKFEREEG